jgi:hypothetical protein
MRDEHAHSLRGEAPPQLPTGDDYRDVAAKIREVARRTRLPVARRELLHLAANYERRGDHLDRRYHYPENAVGPTRFVTGAPSCKPIGERRVEEID